jgi:hypothetical protein
MYVCSIEILLQMFMMLCLNISESRTQYDCGYHGDHLYITVFWKINYAYICTSTVVLLLPTENNAFMGTFLSVLDAVIN